MPSPRSMSRANSISGTGSTRPRPTLEIIPDAPFYVFHGGEHEAGSIKLKGVVRLTTPDPISIARPKIRLEGKRKISWVYATSMGANQVSEKRVFHNQEQRLSAIDGTYKINAGTMEWPFEYELGPSMPETIVGLRETYIVYHLHATVSRPGWNTKDLFAREHIRILRTLGPESVGMTRSRVNADIWANKLSYSISIPTDAVVFGTSITADVELSPIRKGLELGRVELRLMESAVKRIAERTRTDEHEVARCAMDFPHAATVFYDDESADEPVVADEMYKFKATLPLPRSLEHCRQDVDSHQVHISHRFKLIVNIHNPEGHVSQLVCRLPVKLFISPNLPVDDSNQVQINAASIMDEALINAGADQMPPPQYGLHQLDQFYNGIDPEGYFSRAGSMPGTPAGLTSQSRRDSSENLASLARLAVGIMSTSLPSSRDDQGGASPSVLRSRLAALQETDSSRGAGSMRRAAFSRSSSGSISPFQGRNVEQDESANATVAGYLSSSPGSSHSGSAPLSRHHSNDGVWSTTQRADYDIEDLSRVPSYGAALRTSGNVTPHTQAPPSYCTLTSHPTPPGSVPPMNNRTRSASIPHYFPPLSSASASAAVMPSLQRLARAHVRNSSTDSDYETLDGTSRPSIDDSAIGGMSELRHRMLRVT